MRARAGIVLGLVALGNAACRPSSDAGAQGSRPTAANPSASVAPDTRTTEGAGKYAEELAEVAQLAQLVDTFCSCKDRECRHRARTQISAIADSLPNQLPKPAPEEVAAAVKRAMQPMAECEQRLSPPPESPLPAPARLLAGASTCNLQSMRDGVYFTTGDGALKRASLDGKVTEVLPAGVIQQGFVVGKHYVYYGVQDKIRRIPIRGGRAQLVHQSSWPETRLTLFAADRTHVYWEEGLLHRKAKGGGPVADIANAHGPLLDLTVADGYVYYSNGASLGKVRTSGGEPTVLLANPPDTNHVDPTQDRPRLDLPFVERGGYLYGRTEQCGVFRVSKGGGNAIVLTKGASPRDRYFGCIKGNHLSVGSAILFEVATPEDEVLLQVPLAGGEPEEILSAGHSTICAITQWRSKPLIANHHGIYKIGW